MRKSKKRRQIMEMCLWYYAQCIYHDSAAQRHFKILITIIFYQIDNLNYMLQFFNFLSYNYICIALYVIIHMYIRFIQWKISCIDIFKIYWKIHEMIQIYFSMNYNHLPHCIGIAFNQEFSTNNHIKILGWIYINF